MFDFNHVNHFTAKENVSFFICLNIFINLDMKSFKFAFKISYVFLLDDISLKSEKGIVVKLNLSPRKTPFSVIFLTILFF